MAPARPPQPVVIADRISYRSLLATLLEPVSVTLSRGECWVVVGPNGSGKSILTEILCGVRAPTSGIVRRPGLDGPADAAVVSFEAQERVMAHERRADESSIMHGVLDPGTTVRKHLDGDDVAPDDALAALARRFRIEHILDRGLRFLSTGEFRKTLLAGAVARDPALLVLDEPYDGLDVDARRELAALIEDLSDRNRTLVVVANRHRDIPGSATHVLGLSAGRVRYQGPIDGWRDHDASAIQASHRPVGPSQAREPGRPVIRMRDVRVSYGSTDILGGLTWDVYSDERWMIHGPNGSGKSTLLSLITGDNPKAYGQEIEIFGRRKGSGESVWEIKRRIGYVSGDLQFAYPLRTTVLDTVLSGFHDSIGLYERPTGFQVEVARRWLRTTGLSDRERDRLRDLSFGERRLLLVARAVVKSPELLIADEPCQGLDDEHAREVLELLNRVGRDHAACLLYVTHNAEETLDCLTHSLELVPAAPDAPNGFDQSAPRFRDLAPRGARGSVAVVRPLGAAAADR